jgi:hypothetical protein
MVRKLFVSKKAKVINRATSSTVCESLCWSPPISVLEPLLFLIYIHDIGEKLLSLSRLFADDTSLGYPSQNVVEIENAIKHDVCELNTCTWSTKWLISFNPDKTEIMLFSNTDVRYNFNFSFNGNNIPITMSHKPCQAMLNGITTLKT